MTFPYSSTVCHTDTNIKGGVKQNEYVFENLSWIDGPSLGIGFEKLFFGV